MSFFGSSTTAAIGAAATIPDVKDVEVSDPPSDSISSLSFSGAGEFLAVGSWNNEVWLEISYGLISRLKRLVNS